MSLNLQLANTILWITAPILQLGVAGVMFWRKVHKAFPVFFIYLLSQVVTFLILFPAYTWGSYPQFFYSYWICGAISLAVGFNVITAMDPCGACLHQPRYGLNGVSRNAEVASVRHAGW